MKRLVHPSLLLALCACGETPVVDDGCLTTQPSAITVRVADASGTLDDFLAHPWPSDARRTSDGRIRLRAFPNPDNSSTLDDYLETISLETKGFGTNSALYVSFTGPVTGIEPSVELIDIDPTSPERGRRYPLEIRHSEAATLFLPANHMIALPPYGFPLRGETTYALVLSAESDALTASREVHNALREACVDKTARSTGALYAPLRAFLSSEGTSPDRIVGATVFTTQATLSTVRQVAEAARALPSPPVQDLRFNTANGPSYSVEGRIDLPLFQEGEVPFETPRKGGAIARDENGVPRVVGSQSTNLAFVVPTGAAMPAAGWPVVIYAHGTGGDHLNAFDPAVSIAMANQNVAVIGYDLPLHGPRDPTGADPSITFFNLFNIVAARDNFLQGAADLAVLTKLATTLTIPDSVTGRGEVRFDPDRIGFLGHSQGGLIGSLHVAAEPRLEGAVFSGTAGVLAITLLERKDIVDFKGLLESLVGLGATEELDEMHPIINLVQTFIEPADPINYGRTFRNDPAGGHVRDVLFVEGFLDEQSPPRGHEALAAAAGAPLIDPAHRNPNASEIRGLQPEPAPASGNVETSAGNATMGLIQYPESGHWPIFNDRDANRRYSTFLGTALSQERATIAP